MKKCKFCNGKGFTMTGITYVTLGFGIKTINKKITCSKCHGKGSK